MFQWRYDSKTSEEYFWLFYDKQNAHKHLAGSEMWIWIPVLSTGHSSVSSSFLIWKSSVSHVPDMNNAKIKQISQTHTHANQEYNNWFTYHFDQTCLTSINDRYVCWKCTSTWKTTLHVIKLHPFNSKY